MNITNHKNGRQEISLAIKSKLEINICSFLVHANYILDCNDVNDVEIKNGKVANVQLEIRSGNIEWLMVEIMSFSGIYKN